MAGLGGHRGRVAGGAELLEILVQHRHLPRQARLRSIALTLGSPESMRLKCSLELLLRSCFALSSCMQGKVEKKWRRSGEGRQLPLRRARGAVASPHLQASFVFSNGCNCERFRTLASEFSPSTTPAYLHLLDRSLRVLQLLLERELRWMAFRCDLCTAAQLPSALFSYNSLSETFQFYDNVIR